MNRMKKGRGKEMLEKKEWGEGVKDEGVEKMKGEWRGDVEEGEEEEGREEMEEEGKSIWEVGEMKEGGEGKKEEEEEVEEGRKRRGGFGMGM